MDSYTQKIKALDNPSFQRILQAVKESCDGGCLVCKPWEELERGRALLETDEELCKYLCAYGGMHEAKIRKILDSIPNLRGIFDREFSLVDWGCGQGLATVCLLDYLKEEDIRYRIQKAILIEPSEAALDRAQLHVNAYLQDSGRIAAINKCLDEVVEEDMLTDASTTIHLFSNILDIENINLKHLAQLVAADNDAEHFIICVGPINRNCRRIEAFYRYFNVQEPLARFAEQQLPFKGKWWKKDCTLRALAFKLEKGADSLYHIEYYPLVQFHAAYRLDCAQYAIKRLPLEERKTAEEFISKASAFDLSAPFDIGASVYDSIHPVLAVLNNIVTRGLPTKASPFIEKTFGDFGNSMVVDDLGSLAFENPRVEFVVEDEELNLKDDSVLQQILLSPLAVAQIQKVILEALMTTALSIEQDKWQVLVVEQDVPCAALAFEDLRRMFYHLTKLSEDYSGMKFPKVRLELIGNERFVDSPLHLRLKPAIRVTRQHKLKEYDLVIDISTLQQTSTKADSFAKFTCKNNCYFNIRAASMHRTHRHIYTSDTIRYKPLVTRDTQGNYRNIEESKKHLQYFLQLLFRKEDFRPGQLPILDRALQNKSVIGLLPTGGGKSLTYQLAAMLQPGVTLVVDPLNSLMKDQYDGLINAGIDTCTFINRLVDNVETKQRIKQMESSQLQFVFLSPERLCIETFRSRLKTMHDLHVYFAYGVIDEVHCVSEWGHDFRFSYLHLGRNLYNYVHAKDQESHITLFGLTATASFDVLSDVERELSGNGAFPLDSDSIIRYENTNRLELQYRVERVPLGEVSRRYPKWDIYRAKNNHITNYLKQIPRLIEELQTPGSIELIKNRFLEREGLDVDDPNTASLLAHPLSVVFPDTWLSTRQQGGIVFCPHRRGLIGIIDTEFNRGVANAIRSGLNTDSIGTFKGGDSTDDQDSFIHNELPIMVATKAFGMGIDKSNVRFTVNINHPSSLESFVQEAGRAGRDRKMALATILYSDYGDVDKDVQLYFHNSTFKGAHFEKTVMHNLLSAQRIEYYFINNEDYEDELGQRNTIEGFLKTLLASQPNEAVVSYITYQDFKSDRHEQQPDHVNNINKAIYRMCCIELIDDFTQDYSRKQFRIVTKRKEEGAYYQGLKRFLMRYYSEDRAEEEIARVPTYRGRNEIEKCLSYLTEFVYEKTASKRKRALDDMQAFCVQGLDDTKDWKEVNEDLKDFIYFYFNSKYAKDDYTADNGKAFSLTHDTDRGKKSSPGLVLKYLRVIDDDLIGVGGTPKDNVKHLQGAIRLIRRSLTDTNPTLDLLNAFCLFYLGTGNNRALEDELKQSYEDGLLGFANSTKNYSKYWYFFENYNSAILTKTSTYSDDQFKVMRDQVAIIVHARIAKKIVYRYIGEQKEGTNE